MIGEVMMFNSTKPNLILTGFFILLISVSCAETLQAAQTPAPASTPNLQETRRQAALEMQRQQEQQQRQQELRQQQINRDQILQRQIMSDSATLSSENIRRDIENLYRKTSKKELKILAVNEEESKKYELFLKQNKAGLIKLVANAGCSENQNVVVATENCLRYAMPGGGSSYSFRMKDYRISRLADLTFTGNSFQVAGKLLHGILAGIGNIPLEKVSLQSPGLKYLIDFEPVTTFEDAVLIEKQLSLGMFNNQFIYRQALKAVDNMTYVLRSIAYEGEVYRAVNGVTYNELDFDKRRDVIIAFRIVSRDSDKSVTILWKELENKDAPKIKRQDKDTQKIKENNFIAKERKLL